MPAQPAVSMASFHNAGNPCFDGQCLVKLANGTHKRVADMKRGDLVACGPVRFVCNDMNRVSAAGSSC